MLSTFNVRLMFSQQNQNLLNCCLRMTTSRFAGQLLAPSLKSEKMALFQSAVNKR